MRGLRHMSFERGFGPLCRLNFVGCRQSAVGSDVAFGDGIGHQELGAGLQPCIVEPKSLLLSIALRSNAPESKIQNPTSNNQSIAMQRPPKFLISLFSFLILPARSIPCG
ncbi:hypothetical protein [Nitratifractor sp.]